MSCPSVPMPMASFPSYATYKFSRLTAMNYNLPLKTVSQTKKHSNNKEFTGWMSSPLPPAASCRQLPLSWHVARPWRSFETPLPCCCSPPSPASWHLRTCCCSPATRDPCGRPFNRAPTNHDPHETVARLCTLPAAVRHFQGELWGSNGKMQLRKCPNILRQQLFQSSSCPMLKLNLTTDSETAFVKSHATFLRSDWRSIPSHSSDVVAQCNTECQTNEWKERLVHRSNCLFHDQAGVLPPQVL